MSCTSTSFCRHSSPGDPNNKHSPAFFLCTALFLRAPARPQHSHPIWSTTSGPSRLTTNWPNPSLSSPYLPQKRGARKFAKTMNTHHLFLVPSLPSHRGLRLGHAGYACNAQERCKLAAFSVFLDHGGGGRNLRGLGREWRLQWREAGGKQNKCCLGWEKRFEDILESQAAKKSHAKHAHERFDVVTSSRNS